MEITNRKISELKPYEKNAKKHPKSQIEKVANSIKEFGFNQPIVVDKDDVLIVGHGRLEAAKYLGLETVPVIKVDLTEEQAKAYRLADNKLNESDWDMKLVLAELRELSLPQVELTGFDPKILEEDTEAYQDGQKNALREKYLIPPFSIFDTKQAYWQEKKREWIELLGDSGDGRSDTLLGEGLKRLAEISGSGNLTSTSIFDPVLAEISYRWWNIDGGSILDPFAGGNTRGLVASILGYKYTGIDLSTDQIQANREAAEKIRENPTWIHGNSLNIDTLVEGEYDMIFSCPPYYDLEVYTDNQEDISNKENYEAFLVEYKEIIKKAVAKLKNDRFAVWVVGDIRDKEGNYRGLVHDTVQAFKEAGMAHYNDIILSNAIATAGLRAKNTFENNRKVVKIHQNVLVFKKGSPEMYIKAYDHLPQIERFHDNVLVFYKGTIDEIRKNYKVVNTSRDYMAMGLDDKLDTEYE